MIQNQNPSICFLIPYFGKWPFWMSFFLKSCQHNPNIDWKIFTDCGVPKNLPANVHIREISFSDYCHNISNILQIDFSPANAYKLCDIKPALGHIHYSDITQYDFWAFGDLDLIYGDLRAYFTSERLAKYDLYSTHARRVSGHLCLVRNTEKMRQAFRKIPRWQERFYDQKHHALDEGAFSKIFIRHKNFPKFLFNLAAKFNPWRRRSEFAEAYSTPNGCIPWMDNTFNFPVYWKWQKGVITNNLNSGQEFPYFHFAIWKRESWPNQETPNIKWLEPLSNQAAWKIDAKGFHECP